MIKKKRNLFIKLGLCVSAFVGLVCSLIIPSKAYYINNDGNLQSENLINANDVNLVSADFAFSNLDCQLSSNTYTFSFDYVNGSALVGALIVRDSNYTDLINDNFSLSPGIVSYSFTLTSNSTYISFYVNGSALINDFMLNVGTSALDYEPYGTWYSQANYNQYGQERYNDGVNDVYNSLQQQPIAQSSSVGGAILNSDMTFYQNLNITDVDRGSDYIELSFSAVAGKYCSISFSFDSDYYVTNVTLDSFNPPFTSGKLIIEGYEMNISYVDSTWGFYNISSIYNGSTSSITINLWSPSSMSTTIRFKINSLIASIADTQSAYNNGYNNGYRTAENSYQEQVTKLENANATLQNQLAMGTTNANALFWTIASTPFESFKTIWDVDVLGLNISGFVLGVLLALIILYIIKKVW